MNRADTSPAVTAVDLPWEFVMKADRAVEKVQERLNRTVAALGKSPVPFVVIGGNAIAIWVSTRDEGAVRNTKDVDILVARADIQEAAKAMSEAGFDMMEVNGVTVFLDRDDPMPSRGIHVLYAGERVRPHDPYPAPPVVVGIKNPNGVPAADLCSLLILKLVAFRDIDRVHIRDLIHVGLIDQAIIERIPADLRPRLDEILANPDG